MAQPTICALWDKGDRKKIMPKKPDILEEKILARTKLFTVRGVHLRFSNGVERHFEILRGRLKGRSVLIVPMLDDDTVLLVREYGAGVDDYVLAFPKGGVEEGENLLDTANRELMEEVGYGANDLRSIGEYTTSPGYTGGRMQIVIAKDLYEKRLPGDEPEPIEVVPWKLSNIDALLDNPEFIEAKSVVALLLLERQRRNQ